MQTSTPRLPSETLPVCDTELDREPPQETPTPMSRIHWGWLGLWALLTTFAVFEVVKHGVVNGTPGDGTVLVLAAVGFFVAPDLTFLVGADQPVAHGHIATNAVPWYNAMHRMSIPLALTSAVGILLAPLGLGTLALFVGGLSWMAHIALDRAAGYGLRNPDGSRNRA